MMIPDQDPELLRVEDKFQRCDACMKKYPNTSAEVCEVCKFNFRRSEKEPMNDRDIISEGMQDLEKRIAFQKKILSQINTVKEKLYLMSVGAQIKQIDEYCFKCGAIIVGQVKYLDGMFACCRKIDCPHAEKSVDMGLTEMTNGAIEYIVVRKLK